MFKAPPMKLQQIDAFDAQPVEPILYTSADDLGCHRAGRGAPLGECGGTVFGWISFKQMLGDDLGAAIVIGHVEGLKPVPGIGLQVVGGLDRIKVRAAAFHIGDLPKTGDNARDRQPIRQGFAFNIMHFGGHTRFLWRISARTLRRHAWPSGRPIGHHPSRQSAARSSSARIHHHARP